MAGAPLIVLLLGLACTALAANWAYRSAAGLRAERLERLATRAELTLAGRLDTYVALLRGGAGLFAASQDVSTEEFNRYAKSFISRSAIPACRGSVFPRRSGRTPRPTAASASSSR